MQSNNDVNSNPVFQGALGTVVGAGAVAGAFFGGKAGLKKLKTLGKNSKAGANNIEKGLSTFVDKSSGKAKDTTREILKRKAQEGASSAEWAARKTEDKWGNVIDNARDTLGSVINSEQNVIYGAKDIIENVVDASSDTAYHFGNAQRGIEPNKRPNQSTRNKTKKKRTKVNGRADTGTADNITLTDGDIKYNPRPEPLINANGSQDSEWVADYASGNV